MSIIDETENLLSGNSYDLYCRHKVCGVPGDAVGSTLPNLQEIGEEQLYEFMKSRLLNTIGQKRYLILCPKMEYNSSA